MMFVSLASTLPSDTGAGYVAGAYIVFLVIVLIYVAIMAIRLTRVERKLYELRSPSDRPDSGTAGPETPRPDTARRGTAGPETARSSTARSGTARPGTEGRDGDRPDEQDRPREREAV